MLVIVHYMFMLIAVILAVYGVYLAFTKQWKKLTVVAFLFTVTVFILSHVIPDLSHLSVLSVTDSTSEKTIVALIGDGIIHGDSE